MNELQQRIFSRQTQDTPRYPEDQRREPRTRMDRPVYLRPAELSGPRFEEVRTMTDFSRSGFYFITQRESYRKGMQLYVTPAFGCFNFEYIGEVVRTERLPFGDYGVAVRLLRIANAAVNAYTATMMAFQSFARVENTPVASPQQNSDR